MSQDPNFMNTITQDSTQYQNMTGRPTNNSFIKVNKTAQSELEKPFENPEEKSKESTSDNNGEDSIIQDKQTERLNIENGDIIEDMDEDLDQN